jgi:hypothetical protein
MPTGRDDATRAGVDHGLIETLTCLNDHVNYLQTTYISPTR